MSRVVPGVTTVRPSLWPDPSVIEVSDEIDVVHYDKGASFTIAGRQPACQIVSPRWVDQNIRRVNCRKCWMAIERIHQIRVTWEWSRT